MASAKTRTRQAKRQRRKAREKLAAGLIPAAKCKNDRIGHGASGNVRLHLEIHSRLGYACPGKSGPGAAPQGEAGVSRKGSPAKEPLGKIMSGDLIETRPHITSWDPG